MKRPNSSEIQVFVSFVSKSPGALLCASVVNRFLNKTNRGDTETQRNQLAKRLEAKLFLCLFVAKQSLRLHELNWNLVRNNTSLKSLGQ